VERQATRVLLGLPGMRPADRRRRGGGADIAPGRVPFAIAVAMTTPFAPDASLDLDALRAHVELLVEDGVDALVPAATTGEGPLLEEAEATAVHAATVEAARGRAEVIAHVGRPSTAATLRLAAAAIDAGADAVVAVTPYYYGFDQDELVRHYAALVEAAGDVPAYAYAIPERTGNALGAEALERLAGEGLAGIKDSSRSLELHREYAAVARRRAQEGSGFRLLMGSERMLLDAWRSGAVGAVSALSSARPDLLVRFRSACDDGSEDGVRAVQEEITRVRDELPDIARVKRVVSERLSSGGVDYRPDLRAPLLA
jgi:4-hydroxy-tetrahydrodipicolinate synthase